MTIIETLTDGATAKIHPGFADGVHRNTPQHHEEVLEIYHFAHESFAG